MEEIRNGLLYTETHEWIQKMEDGTIIMGITDHAQREIGDIIFVDVPKEGMKVEAGDEFAALESVKTVAPINSPVSGTVVKANSLLEDVPDTMNSSPYDDGWIAVIKISNPEELNGLMDADAYRAKLS